MNAITELLTAAGCLDAARDLDDTTLLARFASDRDAAAFEVLVWRHGGMVRGVCRKYLLDANDIDDVTQAAFLALARKATSVRTVGPWLARVAGRAAKRVRRTNAARAARHQPTTADVPAREAAFDDGWRGVLAEEIARLPDHYRAVVRRCYLDGLSASEAGREFGWARGTVLTRLAWAKDKLRSRLTTRGVTLGSGGVVGLLLQFAAGPVTRAATRDILRAVLGSPGARVSRITEGALTAMFWTKVQVTAGAVLTCGLVLVASVASGDGREPAQAPPRQAKKVEGKAGAAAVPVNADRDKLEKAQALLKKAAEAMANDPQDAEARKLIRDAQTLLTQVVPMAGGGAAFAGGPNTTAVGGRAGGAGAGGGAFVAPGGPGGPLKVVEGAGPGFGFGVGGPGGVASSSGRPAAGGVGGGNSMSVSVSGGKFTINADQDGVKFEITGTAANGVTTPDRIKITDGDTDVDAKSLDKVPAKYRDKVKKLLEGAKG